MDYSSSVKAYAIVPNALDLAFIFYFFCTDSADMHKGPALGKGWSRKCFD